MSVMRIRGAGLGAFVVRTVTALAFVGAGAVAGLAQTDPVTTGSVNGTTNSGPAGSGAFHRALTLINDGREADAYQLARGFGDNLERRIVQWAAIYYGRGAIASDSVRRFAADAPHFATASLYKTRFEQALVREKPRKDAVIGALGGAMPNTVSGQIALAAAYVQDGQTARAARISRAIWVNNFLTTDEENSVRQRLGHLLTRQDHWDRAVHLLMHDRARGTERIMDHLSAAQKTLAQARIAVSRNQSNAQALLDRVDPNLRRHPLFFFALGQLAHGKGAYAQAVAFLDKADGALPDAAEWWYERRTIARKALAAGDAATAYRAAAGYTSGPEGRLVDAHFHAGWLAYSWLGDPATAAKHFKAMARLSTLPDSVSQSHYWLGRALTRTGDATGAQAAFMIAARHSTVYYGQLARGRLDLPAVDIRALPAWRGAEAAFDARELVRAVRLLSANRENGKAEVLARRLAYNVSDPGELVLVARLAQEIGAHNLAILTADIADKRGIALDLFGFPKDGLPRTRLAAVDHAAVYAVARQESRFDIDAVSRSGARGIMQLMPATAKETAQKLGLGYAPSKLTRDPTYNALLGSTYLAAQLDRYDGSLVLAAAAYNAGAGNANKWLSRYGDPRQSDVDAVAWIEAIPFTETRKYVQRVMGNYLVYRARLGGDPMTMAEALRAIPH